MGSHEVKMSLSVVSRNSSYSVAQQSNGGCLRDHIVSPSLLPWFQVHLDGGQQGSRGGVRLADQETSVRDERNGNLSRRQVRRYVLQNHTPNLVVDTVFYKNTEIYEYSGTLL